MKLKGSLATKSEQKIYGLVALWVLYHSPNGVLQRQQSFQEIGKTLDGVLDSDELMVENNPQAGYRHKWEHRVDTAVEILRNQRGYIASYHSQNRGEWVITDIGRKLIESLKAGFTDRDSGIALDDLRENFKLPDDAGNISSHNDTLAVSTPHPQTAGGVMSPMPAPKVVDQPKGNSLFSYFEKKGYQFTPFQIATFYSALKTKGFVILSGLSGTGKTKLAQLFGELFGNDSVWFEPVRPDWRDSKSLLGYVNPLLDGKYQSTGLLRFLLRAKEGAHPTESPLRTLKEWIAAELETDNAQKWLTHYRGTWQRLHNKSANQMAEEELGLIWNEKNNGIASIGQAVGIPLNADVDELRHATAIIQDLSKSPGLRMIEAMNYLHQLPAGRFHWARVLRALALFDPDRVTTIANRDVLRLLAQRLGYDHEFRVRLLVEAKNAEEINQGFQFIRAKTDTLVSSTDPILRAIVPWLVWEFFEAEVPSESVLKPSPCFLILDEMNLAHVEYYFAEFLSVLESGRLSETDVETRRESGELEPDCHIGFTRESIPLHSHETDIEDVNVGEDDENAQRIPKAFRLPPNLYVVGTVNVDETTFAFSPKVLDRAFTIEFRDLDLENYDPALVDDEEAKKIAENIRERVLDDFARNGTFITNRKEDVALALGELGNRKSVLAELGKVLEPYDLHFGYRVLDEMAMFFANAREAQEAGIVEFESDEAILDAALLMKVLPKIHGSRQRLEIPLTRVLDWALKERTVNGRIEEVLGHIGGESGHPTDIPLLLGRWDAVAINFAYPKTARKVLRMLHALYTTGFASFA